MASTKRSMYTPPPPSTSYAAIGADGVAVATGADLVVVLRAGRSLRAAVAVVGVPSGVLLSHIAHGVGLDARIGERAARRWREAHGVAAPTERNKTPAPPSRSASGNGARRRPSSYTTQKPKCSGGAGDRHAA